MRSGEEVWRLRGVYRTPPPLVRYVVRSVDLLLRAKLHKHAGLADLGVRLLDPAAGPMNFLRASWREAMNSHRGKGCAWRLIRDHLLPHFRGLEILPSAHARGAEGLRRFLIAAGYVPDSADPSPALLADALSPLPELFREPANVVIGNPPWRGDSANRGAWIADLLRGYPLPGGGEDEGYFRVDGGPLGERNPKWLSDDYVKFLRLAQWQIDQSGAGVVGFVLNHSFLDALTFRGLRRSLLRTFQEIYVLDLHGNARRRGSEGDRDESVFAGVAQGAAILLLVKKPGLRPRVLRADLRGSRGEKLRILGSTDIERTRWREIDPHPPGFLFVNGDRTKAREYDGGLALPEIFPVHTAGIVTGRDALATALDRRTLARRLSDLRQLPPEARPPDLPARALDGLRRDARWRGRLAGFLARPFDVRFVFYASYFLERPRAAVMAHMRYGANLALIVPRQCKEDPGALVSRFMAGHKAVSAHDLNSLFPLFLGSGALRRPNVCPAVLRRLADLYGAEPEPGSILGFVYAVLYSPLYRQRFRELLQRSFPRIRFPEDRTLFETLAQLGGELIGVHLLEDPRLKVSPARVVGGGPVTRRPRYVEADGCVLVGKDCALIGIAPELWDYRVGAYRVLDRWIQARAGRPLSRSEIADLPRIAHAIRLTLDLQARIEGVPNA